MFGSHVLSRMTADGASHGGVPRRQRIGETFDGALIGNVAREGLARGIVFDATSFVKLVGSFDVVGVGVVHRRLDVVSGEMIVAVEGFRVTTQHVIILFHPSKVWISIAVVHDILHGQALLGISVPIPIASEEGLFLFRGCHCRILVWISMFVLGVCWVSVS